MKNRYEVIIIEHLGKPMYSINDTTKDFDDTQDFYVFKTRYLADVKCDELNEKELSND